MPPKKDKRLKPPQGIRSTVLLKEERRNEIIDAMNRYVSEGWQIPLAWVKEYNELAIYKFSSDAKHMNHLQV